MFCGETIPLPLALYCEAKNVTAAEAAGVGTDTFWNWPAVITAGETVTETLAPEATDTADLTTNERNLLVP